MSCFCFHNIKKWLRRLIAEDDAMRTIFTTLMKHTDDFAKGAKVSMLTLVVLSFSI